MNASACRGKKTLQSEVSSSLGNLSMDAFISGDDHVIMYVCVCVYVCMYVCMFVCMYIRTNVRMYVCMYVCMYLFVYVHGNRREWSQIW